MNLNRSIVPPSALRLFRLRKHITLAQAATFSRLSMSRLSEIERSPEADSAEEVEELRRAVQKASEFLQNVALLEEEE